MPKEKEEQTKEHRKKKKFYPRKYPDKIVYYVERLIKLRKERVILLKRPDPRSKQRAKIQRQRTTLRHEVEDEIRDLELRLITFVTKEVLYFEREWPKLLEKRREQQKIRRRGDREIRLGRKAASQFEFETEAEAEKHDS